MWHDGSQMMKYHVRSGHVGKILTEDQDQAELLEGYSLTRASEINSKSWFIVFTSLHLFIEHRPSSSFVCQFSTSFKKARKIYTPSIRT